VADKSTRFAVIPEGMPIAVTLTLTMVAKRMKDVNVLPKSLSTVETLGCINVLLSDKTGTLTMNQMTVSTIFCDGQVFSADAEQDDPRKKNAAYQLLEKAMILCNAAFFEAADPHDEKAGKVAKGNATDVAVLKYVAQSAEYTPTLESVVKSSEVSLPLSMQFSSPFLTPCVY
jgi:sodium/potassium-transporting ATPase subunit alpha